MIIKKNFKFATTLSVPFLNKPNKKDIHRNKVQTVTLLQQEVSYENNSTAWKDFPVSPFNVRKYCTATMKSQ
jgi:hypothetical protein